MSLADTFEGATIAGALCLGCADQRLLDGGGAILRVLSARLPESFGLIW
jgi:hypothetical protein